MSRRAWEESASYLDWARKPITTGPYKVVEFKPDVSLTLEAHDEYWGGRPPLKRIRFVEVPEVSSRINGLVSGDYQFACDIPPDQIAGIEKNAAFEVQGGTILNHRLTVFDKNHAQLANPLVRRAFTHAIDRQAIVDSLWAGRTRVPNGLQWEFYGDMFHADWKRAGLRSGAGAGACSSRPTTRATRFRIGCSTTTTPTRSRPRRSWSRCGRRSASTSRSRPRRTGPRSWSAPTTRAVRDWSNSAAFNDPVSSLVAQHGPNGQQQQIGEWTNAELNKLSEFLETSTDRAGTQEGVPPHAGNREREDPAYTVLHQNATFTAKPKSIKWKASPAFAMDFRAGNFEV